MSWMTLDKFPIVTKTVMADIYRLELVLTQHSVQWVSGIRQPVCEANNSI
jgi:hypothetical protein